MYVVHRHIQEQWPRNLNIHHGENPNLNSLLVYILNFHIKPLKKRG